MNKKKRKKTQNLPPSLFLSSSAKENSWNGSSTARVNNVFHHPAAAAAAAATDPILGNAKSAPDSIQPASDSSAQALSTSWLSAQKLGCKDSMGVALASAQVAADAKQEKQSTAKNSS